MAKLLDDIMDIIEHCHPKEFLKCKKDREKIASNDSLDAIREDIEKLFANTKCNMGSVEYASLNKIMAICNFKAKREINAIYHLMESHAVLFRQQILHRYQKTEVREKVLEIPQIFGLNAEYVKFHTKTTDFEKTTKSMLEELPKEWYMIQVTTQLESPNGLRVLKRTNGNMHAVHITILPTGKGELLEPFCITLPKPKTYSNYDVCHEIRKILQCNKSNLEATYLNNKLYWKMREHQNCEMKTVVHELEYTWLREWRILFIADFLENTDLIRDLSQMIDKLISDYAACQDISTRVKWLLRKITLNAYFLTPEEIARAVEYVLRDHKKLAKNVIFFIYGRLTFISQLKNVRRFTTVLIIDELIDYLPFESMKILMTHPVTRFSSIYVAYALFKQHEDSMERGCKVIKAKGTCIVNPSGTLTKMEKRMSLFIKYWLPHWKGLYNTEPKEGKFEKALTDYHILMYNGHGSGIQYLPGEYIEKLRVKATVLLFGCCSVKLFPVGGRFPPYGISNQYLIGCSPCVLGTLWEVTDGDIDKMTANFISNWIPSSAQQPWSNIDLNAWSNGILKFLPNEEQKSGKEVQLESEMLRAVARAKEICTQFMTAAAIVSRGLPIKIK